jgi:hypothetical protein
MNVEDMTLEELCRHATTLPEAEEGMREAARAELDRIEYKSLAERWEGLERERDQWRECAEKLAQRLNWWAGPPQQIGGHHESMVALREFERLKEAGK